MLSFKLKQILLFRFSIIIFRFYHWLCCYIWAPTWNTSIILSFHYLINMYINGSNILLICFTLCFCLYFDCLLFLNRSFISWRLYIIVICAISHWRFTWLSLMVVKLFLFILIHFLFNCHAHIHKDKSIEYLTLEFTNQFIIWK